MKRWLDVMAERDWTAPVWPRAYGGGGVLAEEVGTGTRTRGLREKTIKTRMVHLSRGDRLEWLAEQTGVAHGTLRRHYAEYVRTPRLRYAG